MRAQRLVAVFVEVLCVTLLACGGDSFYADPDIPNEDGATDSVVAQIGLTDKALKTVTLENELRDILIERDHIIEDRFDRLVKECMILDIQGTHPAAEVFEQVSALLAQRMDSDRRAKPIRAGGTPQASPRAGMSPPVP